MRDNAITHRSRTWRTVALVAVFTLLAVACSRVPPGGPVSIEQTPDSTEANTPTTTTDDGGGDPQTGFGSGGPVDVEDGDTSTDGSGATTTGGTTDGTTAGPANGGDDGGSTSGGTDGTDGGDTDGGDTDGGDTGSTDGGTGGTPASGPGIEDGTIKIVFHAHFEDCPNDNNEPEDDARQKGKRVIREYVKFFNEYVLADHGWQFEETIVDDGGYECPERQRAAALKIAEEIQPFATLGATGSAQGPIVADVVTRAGILHIGTNWQLQTEEQARHPYAWNTQVTAEQSMRFNVGWMQRRLQGTKIPDRSTPGNPEVDRVYGVLGLDNRQGHRLAQLTRDEMTDAGFDVAGTYFVSADPGVASQQSPTLVSSMRQDGVNTLVWAMNIQQTQSTFYVALTETMNSQNYYPDIVTDWGNAIFAQLANKNVWANAKGASTWPIVALRLAVDADGTSKAEFEEVNENINGYIKAWQEKLGHNDNPQDGSFPGAYGTWARLSLLATGIIHAGDTLTPETFAEGLETAGPLDSPNRCTVARFMGRDYRHAVSYEWNAEHDGGVEGYTTMYWVNEANPPLASGYYESYDNYLYYKSPSDIPPEPTHDTGEEGVAVEKQERIGIVPWKSCDEFPNYPG